MKLPSTFGDLTVEQYQLTDAILKQEGDQLDKWVKILALLSGNTEDFIESHTPKQIGEWFKQISFLNNPTLPDTYAKRIRVGKRFYMPVLKNEDFLAGQLVTIKHFEEQENVVKHLHEMLACVYVPMGWNLKPKPYNSKLHAQIANDMLSVKLKDVYGFLMFKKKVLERSNPVMETYLESSMTMIQETMNWLNSLN